MAFVRAWAEGIDTVTAWHRFLHSQGAGDARRARQELVRLLEELKRLARLHGRPDIAALLCRDPEAIVDTRTSRPTLEIFAASLESDFYSEAELLALYEERFGRVDSRSSARRRQRLRERLVLAIQWLTAHVARRALPHDALDLWLDARVANRLKQVGMARVADLAFWVSQHGYHWYRKVPRLGPKGAGLITAWLQANESSLGSLPAAALRPPNQLDRQALEPPACTGIVPLERFVAPGDDRNGARGSNRAPLSRCKLQLSNDLEAVQSWLQLHPAGSHTWRAYRKEAERLLLWAVMERRKALSSLDADDCMAFQAFLAHPPADWLGGRQIQRCSEAWRPFEGPLSARSQALTVSIVRSLCNWLVRQRYLDANPWDEVPTHAVKSEAGALRALSETQWALVDDWLDAQRPSAASRRLTFLMRFTYLTGLRLAEIAEARLGWFQHVTLGDGTLVWSIEVIGRHGRRRHVPLPYAAMAVLRNYLTARELNPDPSLNAPELPLLAKLQVAQPLSSSRIYAILTRAFEHCAVDVYRRDPGEAQRIRAASTQWLRHSHGAHAAAKGVPQDVLQANLGHKSAAASAKYWRSGITESHRLMQAAFAPATASRVTRVTPFEPANAR